MPRVLHTHGLMFAVLIGAIACAQIPRAAADGANLGPERLSKAEELFARGKQRLAANDYAVACTLLADSYQLDPATGSLLALALCHERQGKLASAFREYEEVAERSRREGRGDREEAARVQVAALRNRISTLTLRSAHPTEDLKIRVNDVEIAVAQLGKALPIDGGFVLVQVDGEGKVPWQEHVQIAGGGEALTLMLPKLAQRQPEAPIRATPPARQVAPRIAAPAPRARSRSASEIAGITLLAAGGAGAILSLGFTIAAVRKNNDSNKSCDGDYCTDGGRALRLDARKAGDIATLSALTATGVAASGLIAYLIGRKRSNETRSARGALRSSAWLSRDGAGAVLSGGF